MALAIEWVSRITTVALEMVLPGILGQWLDSKWGTGFLGLAGFAFGVSFGLWHLLRMTKTSPGQFRVTRRGKSAGDGGTDSSDANEPPRQ